MKKIACVFVLMGLLVGWSSPAAATPILGGPVGLASPQFVITFNELGNLQNQVITNQFAVFGASFTGFGWDNATFGQGGSTGFAGGDLVNGVGGPFPGGPMTISFTSLMRGAAFAAVDQGGSYMLQAFLGGTGGVLVESFNILIPLNPGVGFIGFQNIFFDTIRITPLGSSALTIDTLQLQVPEPASLLLLGTGVAALAARRRRVR